MLAAAGPAPRPELAGSGRVAGLLSTWRREMPLLTQSNQGTPPPLSASCRLFPHISPLASRSPPSSSFFFSLFIPSLFLPSSHHASSLYSRSLPSLVDPLSASLETLHHQVRRFPKKAHFQGPSQLTILSCRVFNPISKLRASKSVVKMVQSAILGFPRMGVNRDLKKATEACKLPFRIFIALILFADRHRLGWQAVPGRPPRRGQAPPSCPLEDPEGCRCRRHPQQRLRPVRPGPLPHPGLWCE